MAETSITIPDVGFVVDAGRVKEERYDPQRHMASPMTCTQVALPRNSDEAARDVSEMARWFI